MTNRNDDKRPEDDPRFKKVVDNLLRTPPKPHKDEPPKRGKKDEPVGGSSKGRAKR